MHAMFATITLCIFAWWRRVCSNLGGHGKQHTTKTWYADTGIACATNHRSDACLTGIAFVANLMSIRPQGGNENAKGIITE